MAMIKEDTAKTTGISCSSIYPISLHQRHQRRQGLHWNISFLRVVVLAVVVVISTTTPFHCHHHHHCHVTHGFIYSSLPQRPSPQLQPFLKQRQRHQMTLPPKHVPLAFYHHSQSQQQLLLLLPTLQQVFMLPEGKSEPLLQCRQSSWRLYMGSKGLNKQAELRRKMELAKQQKQQQESIVTNNDNHGNKTTTTTTNRTQLLLLSDQELKEHNDRLRFEDLLKKSSSTIGLNNNNNNDCYSSDGYLTKQQEEEELEAAQQQQRRRRQRKNNKAHIDRLFQGDPAPEECFQELHHVWTETPIGKVGMERLLPWMKQNGGTTTTTSNSKKEDYVVCLVDPRLKSTELRQAVKTLVSSSSSTTATKTTSSDILRKLIIINADTPAENRRWMKRNKYQQQQQPKKEYMDATAMSSSSLSSFGFFQVYCDEKMEWMHTYTALGEERWSMTLYLLAKGKIQRLVRNVDVYTVNQVVQNMIQSYLDELTLPNN